MVFAVRDLMKMPIPSFRRTLDRVSTSLEAKRQDSLALNEGLGPLEDDIILAVLEGSSGSSLDEERKLRKEERASCLSKSMQLSGTGRPMVYSGERAFSSTIRMACRFDFIRMWCAILARPSNNQASTEQCKNSGRGRGLLGRRGEGGGESRVRKDCGQVHDGAGFLFGRGKDCGIERSSQKWGR